MSVSDKSTGVGLASHLSMASLDDLQDERVYECWPFNGMLAAERSAAHVSDYESGLINSRSSATPKTPRAAFSDHPQVP